MANLNNIVLSMLAFCVLYYPFAAAAAAAALSGDTLFQNYHIHVTNNLPSPNSLALHCKSKNRDLGDRTLATGEDYTWDTKIDLFRRTLFFCNARWSGVKQLSFDSFKAKRDERRCEEYHNSCMWSVRSDGIYFSSNNSTWYNAYPW